MLKRNLNRIVLKGHSTVVEMLKREICKLFARPSGHIRDNLSGVNLQRKESGPPPDNISSGIRKGQHSVEKAEEKNGGGLRN